MGFEDDPKDDSEEYPCDCGGSISQDPVTGKWECDSCAIVLGV